jgi:hypothetical protein
MELIIGADGGIRCVYGEELNLLALGTVQIRRASHVEPDESGRWWVDLSPVAGPKLGPFDHRGQALEAEGQWLRCRIGTLTEMGEYSSSEEGS